jgi:hypothetical protein
MQLLSGLKFTFIAGLSDLGYTTKPRSVKNPLWSCVEFELDSLSFSLSVELDDADDDADELSFVPEQASKPSLYARINVPV